MEHPAPVLALILYGWVEGGGGGRTGDRMIKDLKNLAVTCLGWGQYKMYKSIVPRMSALFLHRPPICERATDHTYTKGCSLSGKKCVGTK